MCLVAVGPLPEEPILRRAAWANSDGIGVAWVNNKLVHYRKGLTVDDLLRMPEQIKENCAVHFRLATVGGKVNDLIHPFPVERDVPLQEFGSASRILMHNGHVGVWDSIAKHYGTKIPKGAMSDSRFMASLVWRYGVGILEMFSSSNRFLIMSRKKNTFIGDWKQEGDRYYSNESYKYTYTPTTTESDKDKWKWTSNYRPEKGIVRAGEVTAGEVRSSFEDDEDLKAYIAAKYPDLDLENWDDDEYSYLGSYSGYKPKPKAEPLSHAQSVSMGNITYYKNGIRITESIEDWRKKREQDAKAEAVAEHADGVKRRLNRAERLARFDWERKEAEAKRDGKRDGKFPEYKNLPERKNKKTGKLIPISTATGFENWREKYRQKEDEKDAVAKQEALTAVTPSVPCADEFTTMPLTLTLEQAVTERLLDPSTLWNERAEEAN